MTIQTVQQGMSQTSPAAQAIIRSGIGAVRSIARRTRSRARTRASSGATSKKRKKRASTSSARRSSSSKRSRLKKGSAAAKAWGKKMAKLRGK